MGWSTGGGVAFNFGVKYPEKTEKIILKSSIGPKGAPFYKLDETKRPTTEIVTTNEELRQDPLFIGVQKAIDEQDTEFAKGWFVNSCCNGKIPIPDHTTEWANEALKQQHLLEICWALLTFNVTDETVGISVANGWKNKLNRKVLVSHGDKDLLVALDVAKEWKKLLGDNVIEKGFENGSHYLLLDSLDDLAATVSNFILN